MWGQFGVGSDGAQVLSAAPTEAVANLNTHDTAAFMGFWQGDDIDDHVALGLCDERQAGHERHYRVPQKHALIEYLGAQGHPSNDTSATAVLAAWLNFLAGQEAEFLLINLEDLWLERAPQNVPGSWQERPNWQRKARYTLADIGTNSPVIHFLKTISDIGARMV